MSGSSIGISSLAVVFALTSSVYADGPKLLPDEKPRTLAGSLFKKAREARLIDDAAGSAVTPVAGEAEVDVAGETLFTATVAFLHQSHLAIGILAQSAGAGLYEGQAAADLLDAHHALAVQVERQLRTLSRAPDLDAADVEVIDELLMIAQLNKWQCEALGEYWAGDATKDKVWEKLRAAAAKELAEYGVKAIDVPVAAARKPTTAK